MRRTAQLAALAGLPLLAAACGPREFPDWPPPPASPAPDAVVYLIGDAGYANPETPVLAQLKQDMLEHSRGAEVVVAFLGDNIYEHGLHEPSHPSHAQDVEYLEAQIDVLRGVDAKGIFVPGNHDWGYGDARGLAQIRRQAEYIAQAARQRTDVAFLPPAACPGPATLPVGVSALLVFIESDLWLRDHDWAESEGCENASLDEALSSLRRVLEENAGGAGRHVIVMAHHPLKTYGPHGGYFGVKDQFFPLTFYWDPLYIPIPFIYPIARNSGITSQDMSGGRYKRMAEGFAAVFSEFPDQPLVQAGGHDHNLQVFDGSEYGARYILVSGAGSKLSNVGWDDALFAVGEQNREYGYMRLEFFGDGRVLLSVITDGTASCDDRRTCPGEPQVRYWRWLAGY
ncbi:MAG: metallophosphoesterase [Gemmatimonadota bacterium]|nr:MAG: metallophosphoesterase [Gemmatimonadota bacterium]